jgi:hypothetical protein
VTPQLFTVPNTLSTPAYEDVGAVSGEFQSRARREGTEFDAIALRHLADAGALVIQGRHKRSHYPVDAEVITPNGGRFLVLAHGNVGESSRQPGLVRSDTLAKVAHRAASLAWLGEPPVVVVTSHLPIPNSTCAHQLADLHTRLGTALIDVVATTGDLAGFRRLRWLFTADPRPYQPRSAPWWNPGHDLTLFDFLDEGDSNA